MSVTGAIQKHSREEAVGVFRDGQRRRQRRVTVDLPRGEGTG